MFQPLKNNQNIGNVYGHCAIFFKSRLFVFTDRRFYRSAINAIVRAETHSHLRTFSASETTKALELYHRLQRKATAESLLFWLLLAMRSKTVQNAHGPGRVDSILFTRLAMLASETMQLIHEQPDSL